MSSHSTLRSVILPQLKKIGLSSPRGWYVYVIELSDSSYYVGATGQLVDRMLGHFRTTFYPRGVDGQPRRAIRIVKAVGCSDKMQMSLLEERLHKEYNLKYAGKGTYSAVCRWKGGDQKVSTQQTDKKLTTQQLPLTKLTIRMKFLASLKKQSFTSKDVYAFMVKLHPERYVHQTEGFATVIEPLLFERRIRRVERGRYEVLEKEG